MNTEYKPEATWDTLGLEKGDVILWKATRTSDCQMWLVLSTQEVILIYQKRTKAFLLNNLNKIFHLKSLSCKPEMMTIIKGK